MKRIFIIVIFMFSLLTTKTSNAQFTIGFSFNIGNQPAWGPVGYDYAQYYYLPDIDVYYNVQQRQYVYLQSGGWRYSSYLPYRARNYNVYRGHKVVINEYKPYLNNAIYRQKYSKFKGRYDQPIIRDSRENKYFESRGHPQHQQWEKKRQNDQNRENKHENGRDQGKGNDKKNGHGNEKGHD